MSTDLHLDIDIINYLVFMLFNGFNIFRFDEQKSVVDFIFPLIGYNDYDPEFEIQKFSSFGFWRDTFSDNNLALIV